MKRFWLHLRRSGEPDARKPAGKERDILATLHAAPTVAHTDLPGFRLPPAQRPDERLPDSESFGPRWRVIFRFDNGATDVNYVDYH
jgi:plasmid maintenance system killer protein